MADALGAYLSALQGQEFLQQCLREIREGELRSSDESLPILRALCQEILDQAVSFFRDREITGLPPPASHRSASLLLDDCGKQTTDRCRKEEIPLDTLLAIVSVLRLHSLLLFFDLYRQNELLASWLQLHSAFFDCLVSAITNQRLHSELSLKQRRIREANHFILQEKRRYRSIFDRMSEPAFIVDRQQRVVDVNRAFEDFFAGDKESFLGKKCSVFLGKVMCKDDRFKLAMENESSFSDLETELLVGGVHRHVLIAGTFLGEINGKFSGGIVIIKDISEKKRYEKKLRESEEKYRSLVENVPDVTWSADENGNISFVSPNVKQLSGFDADEVINTGRSAWFDRIHQEDRDTVVKEFAGIFIRDERLDVSYRFRSKDGVWVWLRDRTGKIYEQKGTRFVDGVLSDITKLKLVEHELEQHHLRLAEMVDLRTEELRRTNDKLMREIEDRQMAEEELMQLTLCLQESNAELEQFAQVASHDMKEPLVLISAFAERLEKKYFDKLDEKGREYVRRIISSANKLRELINALLELARVTTKQGKFQKIDLAELLREVVDQFEEQLRESRGEIIIESTHCLEGDRMQVWQLMQNILGNAIKYRSPGIPPLIVVKSRSIEGEYCEISVADNGIGFSQEDADRIFIPFERLHGRNNYEGSGMGLATCRKIVVRHGGEIMARSTPGQGTTIFVRMPLRGIDD